VLSRIAHGLRDLGACRADDLVMALGLFPTDSHFEVTKPPAERTTNLWKSLRTKHEQRDHEDEDEMRGLKDVANHEKQLSR
jgi:hypothetical protein